MEYSPSPVPERWPRWLVAITTLVGVLLVCGMGALALYGYVTPAQRLTCPTATMSTAPASSTPGTERWHLTTGNDQASMPAAGDGLVYVTYGEIHDQTGFAGGTRGVATCQAIAAVDARTGAKRWQVSFSDQGITYTDLTLANGAVYMALGRSVIALDARTGAQRWRFTNPDFRAVYVAPVVAGGVVYVSFGDQLSALNADTGVQRWRITTNGGRAGSHGVPLVANGMLYVVSYTPDDLDLYSQVGAWDAVTGQPRWRFTATSAVGGQSDHAVFYPVVANGIVYAPLQNGTLYALDGRTGTKRWQVPITPIDEVWQTGMLVSQMTVADGTVYVATNGGFVYALDARTGAQQWKLQAGAPVSFAPLVANSIVYVSASEYPDTHFVYALDARTGAQRWRDATGNGSELAIGNGVVYASSTSLLALDANTGAERWRFHTGTPQTAEVNFGTPVLSDGILYVAWETVIFALNA